jgi:hypothetical protein
MQSDEQLYELSAKELAESPRQGLLIKCMANSDGDENRGKALYIKTRVSEMKIEMLKKAKEEEQKIEEEKRKAYRKGAKETPSWIVWLSVSVVAMYLFFNWLKN